MQNSHESARLGPWRDDDLKGTATAYRGDGSDDDLDPISRFSRSVGRLALRRGRQSRSTPRRDAIAIFLLKPNPPEGMSTRREPMLGDGGVEVCGKIWFANATVQSGRSINAESEDDGRMFDQVERLGLGKVPAVVFNPKVTTPVVRIYEGGLCGDGDVRTIELRERDVDPTQIGETIDWVSSNHLATPDMQVPGVSMWANAAEYRASNRAEAIAQLQLKTAIAVRFVHCEVRHEQRGRVGRTDIEIIQRRADGSSLTPLELEIKVLRERTQSGRKCSAARTERWMRHGVRQAAAYRDDRSAESGMLCCLDMRARDQGEKATPAAVKEYAAEHAVIIHRNFLYNSDEAWRVAHYGP